MTVSKKYLYNITDDPNHSASKIIELLGRGQEVLEVGCASGIQTRFLKEMLACRVTGVEIDKSAAEDARPYCENLIIGNIEDLDMSQALGDQRFDAITFADVLEHLYEPTEALKKVRPFLKKDGYLIASIPNISHAAICWELAHGRFDYQKYGLLDNTHIRFFTKKNVAKLFYEAGYRIVSWDRVVKHPQETEFSVYCASAQEQSFLDWIRDTNPEAFTYQFIVKALPASITTKSEEYHRLDANDTIKKLEGEIGDLNRQKMALESKLNWLENHRFGPFSRLFIRLRNASKHKN